MTTKEPVGVHRAMAAQALGVPIPCGTPYDCGNAAMTVRHLPRLGGNVHMCEPCAATHDEADTE